MATTSTFDLVVATSYNGVAAPATGGMVYTGFANLAAILAATPSYDGQVMTSTDGILALSTGTSAGNAVGVFQVDIAGILYLLQDTQINGSSLTLNQSHIIASTYDGTSHKLSVATGATYTDNVLIIDRPDDGGYSAIRYDVAGAEWGAFGAGTPTSDVSLRNRIYWEFGNASGATNIDLRRGTIHQYCINSSTLYRYPRVLFAANGDVSLYAAVAGSVIDGSGDPTSPLSFFSSGSTGNVGIGTATIATLAAQGARTLQLEGGDFCGYGLKRTGSTQWFIGLGDNSDGHAMLIRNETGGANVVTISGSSPGSIAIGSTGRAAFQVGITVPTQTPASAAASGVAGTITWDASYIYVCTATNTWKRVAIATW